MLPQQYTRLIAMDAHLGYAHTQLLLANRDDQAALILFVIEPGLHCCRH